MLYQESHILFGDMQDETVLVSAILIYGIANLKRSLRNGVSKVALSQKQIEVQVVMISFSWYSSELSKVE